MNQIAFCFIDNFVKLGLPFLKVKTMTYNMWDFPAPQSGIEPPALGA